MPNYKLNLEYNGANFKGSQKQTDSELRTVQGELESRLSNFLKEEIQTTFSGRTDLGVHAIGQVINFRTEKDLDLDKENPDLILMTLNAQLADDMVLTKIEIVADNFNSRYHAKSREYSYKIFIRRHRPVLRLDSLAWYKDDLDFELMQKHCQTFLGKQDFSRYAKLEPNQDPICIVEKAELIKESKICYKFHIKANRFLRHMVRRMVGELIQIGKGSVVNSESCSFTARAEGLTLLSVEY